MGKKAPKAPDPSTLIKAQTEANRLNQFTPGGNIQYGTVDENGNFVATPDQAAVQVGETEAQGNIRNQREALAQQLLGQERFYTPSELQYNLPRADKFIGNLPSVSNSQELLANTPAGGDLNTLGANLPFLDTNYDAANERAANAVYQRGMNFYQPEFDTARDRTLSDLSARGISMDSDAFRSELDRMERGQGQQRENLALSSISAGNQEAGRLFGQDLASRGQLFGEQATGFGLAEGQAGRVFGQGLAGLQFDEQQRQNRMAEQQAAMASALAKQGYISGLENQNYQLGTALGTGNPMFINPPGVDAAGIMQQGYQNQLSAQQSGANNLLGLGNLGVAAYTAFSDIRLKENIEHLGDRDGVNVYEFSYKGQPERYRGVMAQEVSENYPDAVKEVNGYLAVDYSQLPVDFERVA